MIAGLIIGVLLWLALFTVTAGLAWRIFEYARTPQPAHIPLTPAPRTTRGVVLRMAGEVFLFRTLYRTDPWLWFLAWPFHLGLLLVFFHHGQYIGLPGLTVMAGEWGLYAGWVVLVAAGGLLLRRVLLERVRYVSAPSDHLMLVLFITTIGLGMLMTFGEAPDPGALYLYLDGVRGLKFGPIQDHFVLISHIGCALLLMLILPFSKLLHAPAVFFSPTLNQAER